jgi:hypothetical protein
MIQRLTIVYPTISVNIANWLRSGLATPSEAPFEGRRVFHLGRTTHELRESAPCEDVKPWLAM